MPSLVPLANKLPRLYHGNLQQLDYQLRDLDNVQLPPDLRDTSCGITHFYQKLGTYKDGGELVFPNLSCFALNMLALPVSNTDCERLFSKLNLIKTDIRNQLSPETLRAILYLAEAVKEQEACCEFLQPESLIDVVM